MGGSITTYLLENAPWLAALFVAVVATAFAVWMVCRWYSRQEVINSKVKALPCEEHEASLAGKADRPSCAEQETRLNERIESLPCAAHESKLAEKADKADLDRRDAKMSERIDRLPCEQHGKDIGGLLSFERSFMAMSERFDEVCKWLMKFDGSTIDTIAPKHSPRRMNRAGLEIFEETGARKALEDNLPALLSEMEKKSPETAYDVEDRAFEVLVSNIHRPMFVPVKNYLYSCPSRVRKTGDDGKAVEVDLTMGLLIRLMSIGLRDAYLERHPELAEIAGNDEP